MLDTPKPTETGPLRPSGTLQLDAVEHRPYAGPPFDQAPLDPPISTDAIQTRRALITGLKNLANSVDPETRRAARIEDSEQAAYFPKAEFEEVLQRLFADEGDIAPQKLIEELSLEDALFIRNFRGAEFDDPTTRGLQIQKLLAQNAEFRAEVYRQKLLQLVWRQSEDYARIRASISATLGVDGLQELIDKLGRTPTRIGRLAAKTDPEQAPLDPTISSDPEHTLLRAALLALKHNEARKLAGTNTEELETQTRKYVLGTLNPSQHVEISDVTDVFGAEGNLPANAHANDATLIRVNEHWKEVQRRYGVKVTRFDQGASINSPEQCGAAVLFAVNQARRANPHELIEPRFFIVNNASRTEDADGLSGAAASKSSSLLYFSFDLGDGVVHSGVAYGHQTLLPLKAYITELYEVHNTQEGTQFRSLEHEKHIGTLAALADGAAPAAYPLTALDVKEAIPEIQLAENEALYLGSDKYLNGVTSKPAADFLARFIPAGEKSAQVKVAILDRKKQTIVEPEVYTIAQSLGAIRHGGKALWESSTPSVENPKRGQLSIGTFKATRDDVNPDLISLPEGSIIRVEAISTSDDKAMQ